MTTEFVNVKGVADHFKVSERLIRTWVGQGKIPKDTYVHIQQTYRFNLAAVEAALLADGNGGGPWGTATTTSTITSSPDTAEELPYLPDNDGEDRVLTKDNIGTWGDILDIDADI